FGPAVLDDHVVVDQEADGAARRLLDVALRAQRPIHGVADAPVEAAVRALCGTRRILERRTRPPVGSERAKLRGRVSLRADPDGGFADAAERTEHQHEQDRPPSLVAHFHLLRSYWRIRFAAGEIKRWSRARRACYDTGTWRTGRMTTSSPPALPRSSASGC